MKKLPIVIVYFLFPVINIFARNVGYAINRNWIDFVWGILFIVSLLMLLGKRLKLKVKRSFLVLSLIIIAWAFIHFFYNLAAGQTEIIPVFLEIKPFFYALFALLWLKIWGMPKGNNFIDGGVVLSLILMMEFVLESFSAGYIVRIGGSGEINYDAMLLVMATCFLIAQKGFWSKKIFYKWIIILVGLFVSLSRTALVTEIFLWFVFVNINPVVKIGAIIFSMVGIFLSFSTRGLSFIFNNMDRYWMWMSALTMFSTNPIQFLLGFGVQPLPVDIPAQLAYLWIDLQQANWGLSGIYAYNFHAFWLRFAISWGAIGVLLLLFLIIYLLISYRQSVVVMFLMIVFTLEGLTMGTIYLSNVGIPFILAVAVGVSDTRRKSLQAERI